MILGGRGFRLKGKRTSETLLPRNGSVGRRGGEEEERKVGWE